MTMTLKSKLVCPYCKGKQEYEAKDYFVPGAVVSENNQCDHCDQNFNAVLKDGKVVTFTNLLRPEAVLTE